ncbi:MAG: NAD(P)-dependent oxidoreductase [Halieaceae bacterium]|jgi:3-hydroxyisobutyrate dehydrogenase-like beta-hydroxyacid dehydrogenase|nr:NAD(P)-dependent oxidoreductase [Halieaceae bacterium]
MSTIKSVAFIGLGAMGYPMAGHLCQRGFAVTVYNRTSEKAERWQQQYEGKTAPTPAAAAADADVVCLCVGNDDDVRSVVFGDTGVLSALRPGSLLIDHTTTSAQLAMELANACTAAEVAFLDAPVSGGQAGAENGVLTIMIGGDATAYESAQPVLDCYAKKHQLMGPSGAGQQTKMVNQICIAGLLQGLSEALHFAERSGLDIEAVVEVIGKGAAQSWQMENRHQTMARGEFDFGFAVDWMRKDLGIALRAADEVGASLPVTALVDQFYGDVQRLGGHRWDTSSLIERLRKLNP